MGASEWITQVIAHMQRIAVIGVKTEQAGGPAYYVPAYLQRGGFDIVPVPVYFTDVTEILGIPVHRTLATIVPPADTVLLFRRSEDVAKHLDEILAAQPRIVWMQLGISNAAMSATLTQAGIDVVQDRCLKVELARRGR